VARPDEVASATATPPGAPSFEEFATCWLTPQRQEGLGKFAGDGAAIVYTETPDGDKNAWAVDHTMRECALLFGGCGIKFSELTGWRPMLQLADGGTVEIDPRHVAVIKRVRTWAA
jgi:hypothetical protein